jgi:hypothetical protein
VANVGEPVRRGVGVPRRKMPTPPPEPSRREAPLRKKPQRSPSRRREKVPG